MQTSLREYTRILSRGLGVVGKTSHIPVCARIAAEHSRLRPSSRNFQKPSVPRLSFQTNIHTSIAFSCILRLGVVTTYNTACITMNLVIESYRYLLNGRHTSHIKENGDRVELRFCALGFYGLIPLLSASFMVSTKHL
jgi:hypothetical protein